LESKIAAKKKPVYDTRKKIIAGEETNFGEFVTKFDETKKELEEVCKELITKKLDKKDEKEKDDKDEIPVVDVAHLVGKSGVPDFWFKAIKNNQMIFELAKEKDEEILKFVKHVESERTDKPIKSLAVRFYFSENEYFTNDVIELKITYKGDTDEV
jgi:nucleosome assembly protein 1-like 1